MLSILLEPWLFPLLLLGFGALILTVVAVLGSRPDAAGLAARLAGGALFVGVATYLGIALAAGAAPAYWLPALALTTIYLVLFALPAPTVQAFLTSLPNVSLPRWRLLAILVSCLGAAAATFLVAANGLDGTPDFIAAPEDTAADAPTAPVLDVLAMTDRGRPVPLKTSTGGSGLDPEALRRQADMLQRNGLRDQVIHMPSGWQNCNCHGWVFTGGQFFVGGDVVDLILEDNRYQLVVSPRPGDVAVYRNDDGKVTHTGIVRYLSATSNTILVESKWGRMGRFIHPHDVHCYGRDQCTFYRSGRVGHRLRGIPYEPGSTHPVPESPIDPGVATSSPAL